MSDGAWHPLKPPFRWHSISSYLQSLVLQNVHALPVSLLCIFCLLDTAQWASPYALAANKRQIASCVPHVSSDTAGFLHQFLHPLDKYMVKRRNSLRGIWPRIVSSYLGSIAAVMSEAINPGATALHVIPRAANSRATVLVRPMTPACIISMPGDTPNLKTAEQHYGTPAKSHMVIQSSPEVQLGRAGVKTLMSAQRQQNTSPQ